MRLGVKAARWCKVEAEPAEGISQGLPCWSENFYVTRCCLQAGCSQNSCPFEAMAGRGAGLGTPSSTSWGPGLLQS